MPKCAGWTLAPVDTSNGTVRWRGGSACQ
jgi:hypothetical protein